MTRSTTMRSIMRRLRLRGGGDRTRARLIAAGALSLALVAGGTTTASAAGDVSPERVVRQSTTYKVVNISRSYHVRGTQEIGRCGVGSNGTTCSITKTRGATRSIQSSFGLTRGAVAAGLSITSAASVQVSVGCSRKINRNQVLVAYPIGTKYRYRIRKTVSTFTGIRTSKHTSYSRYLTAFSPGGASIYCVVKSR
ncbi:hypothetical protein LK09_15240 [Microbacterium mangrovi]|uniref:Uncharacterized protein n=1 Tax=Microbacterium mangrovi TaxID=1348253 RepID=A0A0B2A034_9MICO|nr:hypothetical protein [Microbacterium mangrovi]KHK96346.1 hypothetical protein LK09_15240 [Microbacterium mangrovi]